MNDASALFSIIITVVFSMPAHAEDRIDPVPVVPAASVAKDYQRAILQMVDSLGTAKAKSADRTMCQQRSIVVKRGAPMIQHLVPMLKYKQANVRRNTAVALAEIAQRHQVKDRKLINTILLRMIEETDLKTRSNLYHVVSILINNLLKSPKRGTAQKEKLKQ